jgi:hypothetical protein
MNRLFIHFLLSLALIYSSAVQAQDSSLTILSEGFYKHLYQNNEYQSLQDLTQQALAETNDLNNNTRTQLLLYYNSISALKLESYSQILNNESKWSASDSSHLHFNHLIIANIAAIKVKDEVLSIQTIQKLHHFALNKEQSEILFLIDAVDTVLRIKKNLNQSTLNKINTLEILTPEDCKDIRKSIHTLQYPAHKSATTAAIMSAIIPGSGKWYAGYFGTPFAALFLNAILGGVSLELALKNGWNSWPAILGYAAFSTFYIGNIYGTVYSVKIKKKENEAFYKGVLLYHLMSSFERIYRD